MSTFVPATTTRVQLNTSHDVNAAIQRRIERSVAFYATASPEMISERLHELDEEWDIERVLEANAAGVSLAGVMLGFPLLDPIVAFVVAGSIGYACWEISSDTSRIALRAREGSSSRGARSRNCRPSRSSACSRNWPGAASTRTRSTARPGC